MGMRIRTTPLPNIKIDGIVMVHPYFRNHEPGDMWDYLCRSQAENPLFNPAADSKLSSLGGEKVLIFIVEKDWLKGRGFWYYEAVRKSRWGRCRYPIV